MAQGSDLVVLAEDDIYSDLSLIETIRSRRSRRQYTEYGISRAHFGKLNRLAFRTGTYYPIMPTGEHLGLIRVLWFIHNITGITQGVWYYHANFDRFTPIRYGDFRFESKYLCGGQSYCGEAAALCVMVADLPTAMLGSSPATYRLAHLEAGIAAQRLYLSCTAMHIDCTAIGAFLDQEMTKALDIHKTTWQPIYAFCVGGLRRPTKKEASESGGPDKINLQTPA